jgi:hypothetical protein
MEITRGIEALSISGEAPTGKLITLRKLGLRARSLKGPKADYAIRDTSTCFGAMLMERFTVRLVKFKTEGLKPCLLFCGC